MTPSIALTHPGAKTAAGADHVRWLVLFMKRCVHFYTKYNRAQKIKSLIMFRTGPGRFG